MSSTSFCVTTIKKGNIFGEYITGSTKTQNRTMTGTGLKK